MQYVIFNVSNLGFFKQSMDALVDGIVDAISRAHTDVKPAKIYVRYFFSLVLLMLKCWLDINNLFSFL